MDMSTADPKGLIRESYRIDGITAGDCRSIILDWALSVPLDVQTGPLLQYLLVAYGVEDHPMTQVLRDALAPPETPKRRGGRGARLGYERDRG